MKRPLFAAAALLIGSSASAATLDFTDAIFAYSSDGAAVSVTVDGVGFTISPTARGADGFRQNDNGLSFGIPGNGMSSISIVADTDIEFVSFTAADRYPTLDGSPSYEVLIDGVFASGDNNVFGGTQTSYNFANGPLALETGEAFLFQPEYFGVLIGGTISAFDFNITTAIVDPSPVPLPAGMPLMLAGLGAFAWMRRRGRTSSTSTY